MKFVVHIGTEKTGTTSLQQFLFKHRKILAEQGVLYPSDLCFENHVCLPALGLSNNDQSEITRSAYNYIISMGYTDMSLYILNTIEMQIKKYNPNVVIFSNEHLHSRLNKIEYIYNIKDILSNFTDSIEVILYIRRQDRLAVSAYSTNFKFGYAYDGDGLPPVFPKIQNIKPYYYDYKSIIGNWSAVFGEENIILRIFEKEITTSGGLLRSFIDAVAPEINLDVSLEKMNESISMDATLFLSKFNLFLKDRGLDYSSSQNLRGPLVKMLENHYPSKIKPSSRESAINFYKSFIDDNKYIFDKYGDIFDDNFDEYELEYEYVPDPSIFAEIAARLVISNVFKK